MITGVRVALTRPDQGTDSIPTFLLFSTALAEDEHLLRHYAPLEACHTQGGDIIRVTWALPDPAVKLGQVDITVDEGREYQARNIAMSGILLLLLPDTLEAAERRTIELAPYHVDWLAVGIKEQTHQIPISGLGRRRARRLRRQDRLMGAARALLTDIDGYRRADGSLLRQAAYSLHEAALLAEAAGMADAWEYFEEVTLMLYPNCHDALIGLAMRARADFDHALPFLARAYAIRPRQEDLALFARTFARPGHINPRSVRDAILTRAKEENLDEPLFRDSSGQALWVTPDDIVLHLQALTDHLVDSSGR